MTPDRWRQIETYYLAACDGRTDALADAPEDVRHEVERMLAQRSSAAGPNILDNGLTADSTLTAIGSGAMLGPYRIDAPIGQGGMGQVFRATDTRLNRTVAIKMSFTPFDPRFQREARAIATLNHPNICTLHDVGPNYLVMELCEGETLAARIRRGKLSIEETCKIGSQIASALAAAHAKSIVHRDLKPANIMLTKTGVKVLDFGLAKSPSDDTVTQTNMVVGTPAYMAPEQREAGPCDGRTDLYSLGRTLQEMAGAKTTPLPERFDHVLQKCLEPDPDRRWQSALDLKSELEWAAQSPVQAPPPAKTFQSKLVWVMIAAVCAAGLLGGLWIRAHSDNQAPAPLTTRFTFEPPPDTNQPRRTNDTAVSPDGRLLAFLAQTNKGDLSLWIRPLGSQEARNLPGTEGASNPFWSFDGQFLAFFARGKLKKVPAAGGPVLNICSTVPGLGGAWGPSGDIVFNPANRAPLMRVSAAGGTPGKLTELSAERQENSHRWPSFLPDGRHFLFTARSSLREQTGIYVGSLDSPATKRLLTEQSNAVYAAGHLIFGREGTLMAQRFDPERLELSGDAQPIISNIDHQTPSALAFYSVSANGRVLAFHEATVSDAVLGWFDRAGKLVQTIGPPGSWADPRIAPDGKKLAAVRTDADTGNRDIWILDLASGALTRFTSDPANDWRPVWSPDSAYLAFASDRTPLSSVWRKSMDGGAPEERIVIPGANLPVYSESWSPDGKFLAMNVEDRASGHAAEPSAGYQDIWIARIDGKENPRPFAATKFYEIYPRYSPDGNWIAYTSGESGPPEVFVRHVLKPTTIKVSAGGGDHAVWRRDGKELLFVSPELKIMSAGIVMGPGDTMQAGVPKTLFRICDGAAVTGEGSFDVSADGQRVLLVCGSETSKKRTTTVLVDWLALLRKPSAASKP